MPVYGKFHELAKQKHCITGKYIIFAGCKSKKIVLSTCEMSIYNAILSSTRTVFTMQSLSLLSDACDKVQLAKSLNYYVSKGALLNLRRGIYSKPIYNEQELACSILQPSYISLEYVLARSGVTFQYSKQLTCVSYQTRDIVVDGKEIAFRQINPMAWTNMLGIEQRDNIAIATPERAFLDMMYLSAGNCYFDNLHPLDKKLVREMLPVYHSKVLTERVMKML